MVRFVSKHLLQVVVLLAFVMLLVTASVHNAEAFGSDSKPRSTLSLQQATEVATESPSQSETPTALETLEPTETPTLTETPTELPSDVPTELPTAIPTEVPTDLPTAELTEVPTDEPTSEPTAFSTEVPTDAPTELPTDTPLETPTDLPTDFVTETPVVTETPTVEATATETVLPTETPVLSETPTHAPTESPTVTPTLASDEAEIVVEPDTDAELRAENDRVIVQIPANAVKRRVSVKFQRLPNNTHDDPSGRVVLNQFSLKAHNFSNPDKAVTQFERPLTISLRYDENSLGGWSPDHLQVVYWDETLNHWEALSSRVDREQQTIIAETNHFTDFGVANAPDMQNYLPNLEGFQTDLFSGAAGYSFPLSVPPGQGGLTPRLSLSYSSAGADMLMSTAQASYVGAGWAVDTSYVARDTRNSYALSDDVYSIVLNGASYDLVDGADGKWHTDKEQFWRITRDMTGGQTNNSWKIITNDGTQYFFGLTSNSQALERRGDGFGNWSADIYQWWLEKVVDTHGNTIEYAYNRFTSSCSQGTVDLAVFPKNIRYNSNGLGGYLSRIEFNWADRTDYNPYQPALQCGRAPYMKKKLDRIDVKTDDELGVTQLVRAYELVNNYNIFEGVYNDHGDGTGSYGKLMLKRIIVHGKDDTSTLPDYVFGYENNKLKSGQNGIGGKVTFTYETTPLAVGPHGDKYEQDYVQMYNNGPFCAPNCTPPAYAFWTPGTHTTVVLNNNGLRFTPQTVGSPQYLEWEVEPYVPGAFYTITQTVKANVASIEGRLKLYDATGSGSETNLTSWIALPNGSNYDMVVTFYMPDSIKRPKIRFYAQGGSGVSNYIFVKKTTLQPQNTHRRIVSKTIDDGLGNVSSWIYSYSGAAVNDAAHSQQVAGGGFLRHKAGSQFRGHSNVTVTDPLGNQTENHFLQNDLFKGKADSIVQRDGGGNKYIETLNTYGSVNYAIHASFPIQTDRIDFIKLDQTRVLTYDGNNGAAAKERKTTYVYDAYGNVSETKEYTDTGAFYRKTCRFFSPNAGTINIVNKLARMITLNADTSCASTTPVSDTRYLYDSNTSYTQAPTVGALKQTLVTKDGTNFFASATYGYELPWGNVNQVTDARGKVTTTLYDTQYHICQSSAKMYQAYSAKMYH